jgi:hypothetical protein
LLPDIFVNFFLQFRWPQWLLVWQSISCSTFSEFLYLDFYTYYYYTALTSHWSIVFLEKLTVAYPKLVKKFPVFYGARWPITVFTKARHLFPSWSTWIQSTVSNSLFLRSSHLHLGLMSYLSLHDFQLKCYILFKSPSCAQLSSPWFDHPNSKTGYLV